jgi:hypothetical protein
VALLTTATQSNGFVNFVQPFAPQDFDEEIIRIDHALTPSDRLTGRYFLDTYISPAFYTDGNYPYFAEQMYGLLQEREQLVKKAPADGSGGNLAELQRLGDSKQRGQYERLPTGRETIR